MLDVIRRNSQSWVVKVIFGAIILTFVFWGANTMTSDSADVLAKVNGESIYRNDLLRELRVQIQNIQMTNPNLANLDNEQINAMGMQLLGNMVRRSLLAQEAHKLGIGVSDQEFSQVVTSMREFQDGSGRFNQEIYKDTIAALGMKINQFEESVTADILVGKLQNYITSAVNVDEAEARRAFNFEMERRVVEYLPFQASAYRGQVNPDNTAIIAYYSENKDSYAIPAKAELEYLLFDMDVLAAQSSISDEDIKKYYEDRQTSFVEPARYHVRHILISLPLTIDTAEEAVVAARAKADDVLAQLRGGKKFATLAKKYSDDDASKEKGGDIGWVQRGELVPSIDAILPDLKPGVVSEPIRTAYGFHLVELVESSAERARSFDEVRGEILAQLKEDAAYANMGKTISDVEDKIITGGAFEALAADYGVKTQASGLLDMEALAPALGLEAATLAGIPDVAPGKMLPPIDLGRGFMVVKVKSYQPSFVPEMEAVKAQIVESIKDRDSMQLASDAAAAAAKEIAAQGKVPPALARKVSEAAPTTRFLGVMELGFSQDLLSAVFTAPKGEWLDRVFVVGESAALVRVKDILPAEEKDWSEVGSAYIDGLNSARKNELFGAYIAQLQKEAKIEIKTDRIVGR